MPDTIGTPAPSAASAGVPREVVRRRALVVLSLGQVLGGIGFGSTISLGAVITERLTGDEALAGLPTAAVTLGAALLAVPLASFASRSGRRPALALGMLLALVGVALVVVGTAAALFPVLLVAFALIGAGQAANLQSRFAATDLATDRTRGRDLSIVVWATTIGAVLGPNLIGAGEALGDVVGMPPLTGPYLFTAVAQLLAIALYLVALRPDPLLLARTASAEAPQAPATRRAQADRPGAARYAVLAIAGSHGVMVSVMAMTPLHLVHHGAELSVVGLTISLHIAGMYALSPLFGILADRLGRVATVLLGQALLAASLVVAAMGADSALAVTASLILLGLGWSGATVAGSALLTEASSPERRTARQGRSDAIMNVVGAAGAAAAGGVLGVLGYAGLAVCALAVVAVVVIGGLLAGRSMRSPDRSNHPVGT
ncbi:MFS transporter [Microbacterium sp. NPDC006705]|uniref:MFS transporter n=1 Tax=Microbacterium TaxID=33882 RepID=UPI00249F35E8|nr:MULTISPECIES: MFS transporter [Microbacterium]WHE37522.1 MFS transporter [Microbacterium sp. BDGP8]WRK18702.1 MFS transporter [Microbacterium plantarum]